MNKEILILVFSWVIAVLCLLKYVPKDKRRVAHITFLFGQAFSWLFEYFQVRLELLEFPFREFNYATKMSFSLHYVIFPTYAVFFILLYPIQKAPKWIIIYYLIYGMALPTYAFFLERYSSLIDYKKWNWFLAVIVNLIAMFIVKKFVFWFKKGITQS
ncbi:CBO0543 family protein [Neobacillus niacini]|uniref:CBO0543 family protein n=1 Tax=Neobacillus niacini TaxID=86668 RepID=UPI0005EECD70|nr:CBO0543 family protein [Neobacillus niacini]